MTTKAASEAGKALVAQRKIENYTCVMCGKQGAGYPGKLYCSEACKQRAKYQRKKEREK